MHHPIRHTVGDELYRSIPIPASCEYWLVKAYAAMMVVASSWAISVDPSRTFLPVVVDCLDLDDYTAITYVDTADLELVIGQEYPNKIDIISSKRQSKTKRNDGNLCENSVSMTLRYHSLNIFPCGCTRPHAVPSDCPRKRCVVRKVGVGMDISRRW